MKGVSVLFFLGLCTGLSQAIFLNHRPFPTYSLENMPKTSFSCREKILGGYYADADTECQMFHVCVKVAGIGVQDFRFLCPNGTAFDQDHQICADWEDIDCDATTLYYSSDNFDLYRIGSGFESKAQKYGEDEDTFALQRAETGDARINHEQKSLIVDQTKAPRNYKIPKQTNNNDKEIFKSSSSSNFYNSRNNGKERDEDYEDTVNINQNQDYEQKRKVVKNTARRPVQNQQNNNNNQQNSNRNSQRHNDYNNRHQNEYNRKQNTDQNRNQNTDYNRNQNTDYNRNQNTDYNRNQNTDYNRNQNTDQNRNQNTDYNRNQNTEYNRNDYTKTTQQPVAQTRRPAVKFTGFVNNFAGSYEPTTTKPTSTTLNSDQYTTAINNYKHRNGQRQRHQDYTDSPVYTISTPAPFKSQQQYNSAPVKTNNNQYYSTTLAPQKSTAQSSTNYDENYDIPKVKASTSQNFNNGQYRQYDNQKTTASQYETTKIKQNYNTNDKTENYPSNNPKYTSTFDKKQTTPYKQNENYPTTLSPKPFSLNNFPTTFAPRTNAAYNQISQQTVTYNQNRNTQNSQSSAYSSTPKSTPFTQYTPTVPKLSSTTPVSRTGSQFKLSNSTDNLLALKVRSSRFDETQYDDGSYSSKYDYDGDRRDDEFLKTAHSQNIAASRNELNRNTKQQQTTPIQPQKQQQTTKFQQQTTKVQQQTTKVQQQTTQFQSQKQQTTQFQPQKQQQTTQFQPQKEQQTTQFQSQKQQQTTQFQPQKQQQTTQFQPQRTTYDVPKTFSSTTKQVSKVTEAPKTNVQSDKKAPVKKLKDASYDYAYYDSNAGSEPDYEIDTEIKKSTVKN